MNSDPPLQFPKCPRCGGEWERIGSNHGKYQLTHPSNGCKVNILQQVNGKVTWIKVRLVDPVDIHWNTRGQCMVEIGASTEMMSCALPFTITQDKLKLYLTFS